MEAGSSLSLWSPVKTNSLRLMVENEQRKNEVKDLIRLWGLEGKMNVPIKFQKTANFLGETSVNSEATMLEICKKKLPETFVLKSDTMVHHLME